MVLWKLPIPYKIRTFMWLLTHNKLLTKKNLARRGWPGCTKCHFCTQEETHNHLFLKCRFTQQIWYWMGISQQFYLNWHSIKDIITFSFTLPNGQQQSFLIVFSALCWTLWKIRNEICFQQLAPKSFKTTILLIISLVSYWLGNTLKKFNSSTGIWLPGELDEIPLQALAPEEDTQLVILAGQGSAADPQEDDGY